MNIDIAKIFFTEAEIKEKVCEVGRQITEDYKGKNPLVIGILKGCFVFMSDLVRAIDINCEIDFMVAKSYGNNTFSSGSVEIKNDLSTDILGRHVILVEDILDSARTIDSVIKVLKTRNPASIKICTLLDKKVERSVEIKPDYKCFDVENEFVVGYGLDYAQRYRNLPYIGILKKEIYEKI